MITITFSLSKLVASSSQSAGSGREGLDPAFSPLFRENPASRIPHVLNPALLSQKNTLKKSLISTKANKCKIRWRLIRSIDVLNLRVFLNASAKRNSFLYLSVKKAGITICHVLANLALKVFKKSPQDYNKWGAAEETEELN